MKWELNLSDTCLVELEDVNYSFNSIQFHLFTEELEKVKAERVSHMEGICKLEGLFRSILNALFISPHTNVDKYIKMLLKMM